MAVGFFPSFAAYKHKECPLDEIYETPGHITRVKTLLSEIIECSSPLEIKQKIGGHDIMTIRPTSAEAKRVLKIVSDPDATLHKIDYGNNKFRIYFGLSTSDRMAKIYMIDTRHRYFT